MSEPTSNDPIPNEKTATTDVHIEATPDEVWTALTTDEGLERWMGDGASIDPRPDGSIEVPDVVSGRPRRGRVTEIEPARRLGFEWWPDDDPTDRSTVEIDLMPSGPGTTVTVTEVAPRIRLVSAQAHWAWRGATLSVSSALCRR